MDSDSVRGGVFAIAVIGLIISGTVWAFWGWPSYQVYAQTQAGQAALRSAEYTRQIAELDAKAAIVKAQGDAQAEVERAKGAAEANKVLADSLAGKEEYLNYLYIQMLRESNGSGREIIYIPTEGGLPLLEAGRAAVAPEK